MSELVSVTAVKAFPYRGRTVAVGEACDVTPVDALSLTYRRLARFSKQIPRYRTAAVTAESPDTQTDPEKPKRRYRRRDLQADE